MDMQNKSYFIVTFRDPENMGECLSLKCRKVHDSSLGLSFVSLSDFIFDTSKAIVNPKEENMEKRFKNVKSLHICIYNVVSIEEVGEESRGLKFENDKSKLLLLNPSEPTIQN